MQTPKVTELSAAQYAEQRDRVRDSILAGIRDPRPPRPEPWTGWPR